MTNYEKIKAMSIEEITKLLEQRWFGKAEEVKEWLGEESK